MYRALAILLIVVSTFLLFWRLGDTPIWRDEATTAVWARGMAEHNALMPWVAYDGQLMVQAEDGHDVNSKLLPAMQSYLQFYVVAASFKLLGVSEFTARLPFALLGLVTLFVLWRIGETLFGPGLLALVPPGLASVSILFLQAARQCRYYIMAGLFSALVIYEICRYLKDPELARNRSFYIRLAVWGFGVYMSNYLGFLGFWTAVGLWVLWQRDVPLIRNFIITCAGMAVIILADFFALHAEFATSWPPLTEPLLDTYQTKLTQRGSDYWRVIPFVFFVPAGLWLAWERRRLGGGWTAAAGLALAMTFVPLLWARQEWSSWPAGLFWPAAAAFFAIPAALYWGGGKARSFGPWSRAAVLGGLILIIGPLVAVALAKSKANTRHYYQMLPGAMLVSSLAVAGLAREGKKNAAAAMFVGMALWPSLDLNFGGTEGVVWRQYLLDGSYEQPMIDMLNEHVPQGAKVGFVRNVKGMPAYFYRPDMRWVELLATEAPHNQKFRELLPADQFDDCECADWYVFWDPRGRVPKGFSEDKFELVDSESFTARTSWWDRDSEPWVRTFELWRRIEQ